MTDYVNACDLETGIEFWHGGNIVKVATATEFLNESEFNEQYYMKVVDVNGLEYRFKTYLQLRLA